MRRTATLVIGYPALVSFAISLVQLISNTQISSACQQVYFGSAHEQRIVCKCDSQSRCAAPLDFTWPEDDEHLLELTSSKAGARFQLRNISLASQKISVAPSQIGHDALGVEYIVQLDVNKRLQRVLGYGGAFTDSASMLIVSKLDEHTRNQLMDSYFGPSGLDYNLARVPIGGTDMSWRPYSYNDIHLNGESAEQKHDFELKQFMLQPEDFDYKLPLIRQANSIRRASAAAKPTQVSCLNTDGTDRAALRLLASSWSAPNWMKSNYNLVQGRLKDSFDGKYYDAYARYLIRFMDEYERELNKPYVNESQLANATQKQEECRGKFKFWALTPQNEPCTPGRLGHSVVNYNSVNFEPKQMAQFVRFNLIPNLLRANRTARHLALFIWDDTLLGFEKYKNLLFSSLDDYDDDDDAILKRKKLTSGFAAYDRHTINDYVRGLALHWYSQGLDKLPYKSLYDLRRWLPDRYSMISTEASFISRPKPGEWLHAEKYARDIIENLRSGSIGWIDWNLALNMDGGPTWSRNFLDAAILIDDKPDALTGKSKSLFYQNPMYHAIGHLSRFVKTNSHILKSELLTNDRQPHQQTKRTATLASAHKDLSPDEASRLAVLAKDPGWRLVDEVEEQTSDLLVVASELDSTQELMPTKWRRIALVILNRSNRKLPVRLNVANCQSRLGAFPLALELEAKSISSYAFNC